MSQFTCGDGGALAAYLYGECDGAERVAIEAHLAACASCAGEVAALADTRTQLSAWTPPDAALGFTIVPAHEAARVESARVLRPARWWQQPLPAWAQAAAAVAIFAAGASLGTLRGAVAPATGPRVAETSAVAAVAETAPARVAPPASAVSRDDLAALEARFRAELQRVRADAPPASAADADVLRRVRALLAESEQRQRQELALRMSQVVRDVDNQRRVDFARLERTFGRMEGLRGAEAKEQQQMLNYLMRVSQRPQ